MNVYYRGKNDGADWIEGYTILHAGTHIGATFRHKGRLLRIASSSVKPYFERLGVRLYMGDCRDVLEGIDERLDAVITDPPYASGARRDADRQVRGSMLRSLEDEDWFSHDAMTTWGFAWFMRSVATQLRPKLARGAHVYAFSDWRMTPTVYGLLEGTGYRVNHCLVWAKTAFGMGTYWRNQHENIIFASNGQPSDMARRDLGSVLTFANVPNERRIHPTEKPVPLLKALLSAIQPDALVLDPFGGSGSLGEAALNLGRRAILIEIDEGHAERSARRLENAALPMFGECGGKPEQAELIATEAASGEALYRDQADEPDSIERLPRA